MLSDILHHFGDIVSDFLSNEESWILLFILVVSGGVIIGVPSGPAILSAILQIIWGILQKTWWLWFFLIIFSVFRSLWLFWRQELYKKSLSFTVLELKVPREAKKSPQSMEQILQTMYQLRNTPSSFKAKYWAGEITKWFSLEMISFGGEVHLYIRLPSEHRNVVEAAFFSYYQDVELVEVSDYMEKLPATVREARERNVGVWGTELLLTKPAGYPIRTYVDFEHAAEEKEFDPISAFLELLSKIKVEEVIGVQIVIAPTKPDWGEKWASLIADLRKPATISTPSDEGMRETQLPRSRAQTELLEAVESNISKPAFDTLIRVMYLSPQELFSDGYAKSALLGAFNQYSSLNLNGFKQNSGVATKVSSWKLTRSRAAEKNAYREQRMLYNFRTREVPPETWMGKLITSYPSNFNFASTRFEMNTECIATLFHPPTVSVLTAPHMVRVESRKTGPPAGLAIYGEERDIERFS